MSMINRINRINLWRRKENYVCKNNTVVAIGNFDGLHLGHQKILELTQHIAAQLKHIPVLLTFEPYPQQFFHPEKLVPRLTTLREKVGIIQNCVTPPLLAKGVDAVGG